MTKQPRKPSPHTFKPGQSGNPAGKPAGARNKATMMVLALMEGGAKEITEKIIEAAKAGDLAAARLVIERIAPPLRERPVSIDLPDTSTSAGIGAAQQAILKAVGAGDLSPGEGSTLATIVETRRRAFETEEIERRLAALEASAGKKG